MANEREKVVKIADLRKYGRKSVLQDITSDKILYDAEENHNFSENHINYHVFV